MEIKGKVHCFFEQSGTFKNEFIKLGIPAEDYDIQDEFGQTDNKIDLFAEIEKCYNGKQSIYDKISGDDLIMAFFPCIYFSAVSQMNFYWTAKNNRRRTIKEKTEVSLKRSADREYFFRICIKMISCAMQRNIPLILENPWSEQTFLKGNFIMPPTIVDNNRMLRGDYFVKPTAYWFFGCEPTKGFTLQHDKTKRVVLKIAPSGKKGICNTERSLISPDYARNFICDFIIGKSQQYIDNQIIFS